MVYGVWCMVYGVWCMGGGCVGVYRGMYESVRVWGCMVYGVWVCVRVWGCMGVCESVGVYGCV